MHGTYIKIFVMCLC